MTLGPRLEQRQSQGLVMTPRLQQSIELLRMTNLELADFVAQELESNPLLERAENREPDDQEPTLVNSGDPDAENRGGEQEEDERTAEAEPEALEIIDFNAHEPAQIPEEKQLDVDYDNDFTGADATPVRTPASASSYGDASLPGIDQTIVDRVSLRDHLAAQAAMALHTPVERMIAQCLIECLDEAGYLRLDTTSIAAALACPPADVEAVLEVLQGFDPTGVFARSLAECLRLQLCDRNRYDPAMAALLRNLDLVAKRDVARLQKACAVDHEDIVDMINEITALNPKPAFGFDGDPVQPITPDVLMRPAPGKVGWILEIDNVTLPRVLVDKHYYVTVHRQARDKAEKHYIAQQYQSANWLIRAMDQRATTILKVAAEIVRQQDDFFLKGVQYLKPLIRRDVAERVDLHESTVSRVTANKYISTPRGIFELKYFFTSAIAATGGAEDHSSEAVRACIKDLIDAETITAVLSDDKIVKTLKANGMDIARRTVAKYRKSMKIPSSIQRKREKRSIL